MTRQGEASALGREGDSRRETLLLVVVCVAILFACNVTAGGGEVKVDVKCVGSETAINCDVKHTEGDARVEACWDLIFDCQNGSRVTGSGCQQVGPGETATKSIPVTELTNYKACDKVTSTQVTNLKLSEL